MKNIYKIIDTDILIDYPYDYHDSEGFEPFKLDSSNKCDTVIKFYKKDSPLKFNLPVISHKNFIKVYRDEKTIIKEYECRDAIPYACMIEENNSEYKFYCYDFSKEIIKDTYDIFKIIGIENICYKKNTFILHASYIKYNDYAILFSAPSGIGKSTQAKLWQEYENAEIINGDRVAINKNRGEWNAFGLPYAGSSQIYKNITTPIKAVIILKQAKSNSIGKLDLKEAFKYIYSETSIYQWNYDFVKIVTDLIYKFVTEVPVYIMQCLPDCGSVELLKMKLEGE